MYIKFINKNYFMLEIFIIIDESTLYKRYIISLRSIVFCKS